MTASSAGGRWLYSALLGAQTVGAVILFGYGVPSYRGAVADPAAHSAQLETLGWSVPAMALMQIAYWTSFRLRPPPPPIVHPLLGHVVLWLARFAFVFASGVFSFVFLVPMPGFSIPVGRYVTTALGTFAIFCYTRELERFGQAMLGPAPEPRPVRRP